MKFINSAVKKFCGIWFWFICILNLGNFRPENEWTRQAHLESVPKGGTGNYTDGSIESDLPMQQLSELFNVNHFIVSQVGSYIGSSFGRKVYG